MSDMSYEQKLHALNAIAECKILMRKPQDWYVSQSVGIKRKNILCGECGGGKTPQEAIENHWNILTNLEHDEYLVCNVSSERKTIKWNGFMWEKINE